ncbi:MAG: NAD+ synthase, partial [Candidatus Omnitrophica bacterium]|nr:NAD+ synthase [Candidatus Omnitrophota bacterium]
HRSIRFAIAQMDPTVGDYVQNTSKILTWVQKASRKKADLIVFPEAALCGYPVWDLANKKQFVAEGRKQLSRIAAATRGKDLVVVLGFIDRGAGSTGSSHASSYNALAWIEKGKVRTVYHKQLLPTYDVFLEEIFFRAGDRTQIVPWKGYKIGLTICEDIWDASYETKPLRALKRRGADLVINISASPYYRGVAEARDALLQGHTRHYGFPVLYVNQAGAQDDLLFDGRSLFCDAKGTVLFRAPAFTEGLFFYDGTLSRSVERPAHEVPLPEWTGRPKEIYDALVMGLKDYFQKNGFKKAVIGLSGGIDSALVATIAVDALGADAVKGVAMPGPFSTEGSRKDAEALAQALGIAFEVRPISDKYHHWLKASGFAAKGRPSVAMENLQARLRGLELMFLSNDEGRLVLTTGNKSELAMGYCTLYGDMAGGLAVIGDVYKTDVYRLAWYRNSIASVIPKATLTKAPSAELRPDQKDEDSLPPYEVLDEVLYLYIEKNLSRDEILRKTRGRIAAAAVVEVIRKVDHNEYKRRQTPPILRVSEKAWFGRRMPITNRFQG